MDLDSSEAEYRGDPAVASMYGFQVQSYGKPVSPGFKRGLRRLAERGFADRTCVVVKTNNGSRSGITHAGGRYVDPDNPYRREVMRAMEDLGMEPPAAPFLVAPGEYTLYHEWGHHVDRTWSGDDRAVSFSFRWFSRFYQLGIRPLRIAHTDRGVPVEYGDVRPIESADVDSVSAVVPWWHVSSELFADLFEDWMRGDKKNGWDHCEPNSLNSSPRAYPFVRIFLRPEVLSTDVRAKTYGLFTAGIKSAPDVPPVRSGLFGPHTHETVDRFRKALSNMGAGRR